LLATDNAVALEGDGLRAYLNGINEIFYSVYVEPTNGGDECKIDNEKLTSPLQFIANQSTKLHIIAEREYSTRVVELTRSKDLIGALDEKRDAAIIKRFRDYTLMPQLHIGIYPLQNVGGCSGHVEAKLSVHLTNATVIPTGVWVLSPETVVWSVVYGFVCPRQLFPDKVINIAEQEMKAFVNDWAASQREKPSQ
jgi:hypothetical protein